MQRVRNGSVNAWRRAPASRFLEPRTERVRFLGDPTLMHDRPHSKTVPELAQKEPHPTAYDLIWVRLFLIRRFTSVCRCHVGHLLVSHLTSLR